MEIFTSTKTEVCKNIACCIGTTICLLSPARQYISSLWWAEIKIVPLD